MDRYVSQLIEMKYINEPPQQLRMEIDEESLMELTESIKQHGLINPITLYHAEDGSYTIIAGHRRFLACKKLQWEEIPARVISYKEGPKIRVLSAVENLQRQNLNIIEEADLVMSLHYEEGLSINHIADMLNRSRDWVCKRLEITQYPMEVLEALKSDAIRLGAARLIASIQDEGFRKWVLEQAISSGATEHMIATWIKDNFLTLNPAEREEIIKEKTMGSVKRLEELEFECGVCNEREPLSQVMIVRVCKQCYYNLQIVKQQHGQQTEKETN